MSDEVVVTGIDMIDIKEHSDERQFWEDMLEQKFITWKECLAGMRACRKRERIY